MLGNLKTDNCVRTCDRNRCFCLLQPEPRRRSVSPNQKRSERGNRPRDWLRSLRRIDPDLLRTSALHDLCEQRCRRCSRRLRPVSALHGILLLDTWDLKHHQNGDAGTRIFRKSIFLRRDRDVCPHDRQPLLCRSVRLQRDLLRRPDRMGRCLLLHRSDLLLLCEKSHMDAAGNASRSITELSRS